MGADPKLVAPIQIHVKKSFVLFAVIGRHVLRNTFLVINEVVFSALAPPEIIDWEVDLTLRGAF